MESVCSHSQHPNLDLDDDIGTSVDAEEGDIDRESDVEYLGENKNDVEDDLDLKTI